MTTYVLSRLKEAVPVAIVASVVVFLLLRLIPGDTAQSLAGPDASQEVVQAIRRDMGLDQPLAVQYGIWLLHVVQGDFGRSVLSRRPVSDLLAQRIPATMELAFASLVLAVVLGIPTGIVAALKQRSATDTIISSMCGLLVAIPNFWFGILALMVFVLILGWLPPGGRVEFSRDPILALKALCLPAVTLSLSTAVNLCRLTRASMLDVMHADFVRTARSKGLGTREIVIRHVLRNALVPVITVLSLQTGRLLGGSVIVESVFGWPGVGRMIVDGIGSRDYAVVQAGLLLLVLLFIVVSLVTDVIYGYIDPRIRFGAKSL